MPVFSMSVVTKLSELTARQVRYYETHELIKPHRSEGNKRLFSLNDLERLLEIKRLIEKGFNLKGIKQILNDEQEHLSDVEKKMSINATKKEKRDTISINRIYLYRFIK